MTSAGGGAARRALPWILPVAAAFAVRLAAGLALPGSDRGPRGFDFYGYMADHVLDGRGLCWSFYESLGWKYANRGPLYPLLVAGVRAVAGSPGHAAVVAVQAAVGAAATVAAALLAARWSGRRAALLALWIGALWPYSVAQDVGLLEHVLHAPLCVLACLATMRAADGGARSAFVAGVVAGAATLARLTFQLTAPFLAWTVLRRRGVATALVLLAGVAAALAPWVVRNHAATGHLVVGTDGGRALWVGNAAATFLHYPDASIDEGERELFRRLGPDGMESLRALRDDEVAQDRRFLAMAADAAAADPWGTVARAFRKAGALWSPVLNPGPQPAAERALFAATLLPLLAAAAAGAATCGRMRADLPVVLATAGSATLTAMLFWGQSRYLAPLHGIAIAMAAAWLTRRPETPR